MDPSRALTLHPFVGERGTTLVQENVPLKSGLNQTLVFVLDYVPDRTVLESVDIPLFFAHQHAQFGGQQPLAELAQRSAAVLYDQALPLWLHLQVRLVHRGQKEAATGQHSASVHVSTASAVRHQPAFVLPQALQHILRGGSAS